MPGSGLAKAYAAPLTSGHPRCSAERKRPHGFAIHAPPVNEVSVFDQPMAGRLERRLLDAIGFAAIAAGTVRTAQRLSQGGGIPQAHDEICLVDEFISVLERSLPEFAAIVDHAGPVAKLGP